MKRLVLECGGKSPSIVFDDGPSLEVVAERVIARAFWNQRQVCTASSRLLVHDRIKENLLFGAVVSREHQQKVLAYVSGGERDGARIVHEGASPLPFNDGFYAPATV